MQKLLHRLETIPSKEKQAHLLLSILVELQYLLFRIQFCDIFVETHELFDLLEETQLTLTKLNNRSQVQLPPLLLQFIVDFSDVYDQKNRRQLFENIKENQYIYADIVSAFSKILSDFKEVVLKPRLLEAQKQLITKNIQNLLRLIAAERQSADADIYFEKLLAIQELLSQVTFVYNIPLNEPLMQFIYDCDRLDDSQTRIDLFKRIKQGEYNIFNS